MKVLIGCEFSGVVRSAFRARGHDAWSCDYLPADDGSPFHIQKDVLTILHDNWQLAIFHPPCTYLCRSGIHWNSKRPERAAQTEDALKFVKLLLDAPIHRIAVENPIGVVSTRIRKPDQIIQPWHHGHPESKSTCLWLKNLPLLCSTNILPLPPGGKWDNVTASGQNKISPGPDRWKLRSITYQGVANAMADQWGK